MASADVLAEIWNALRTPATGDGWSCFVSNKAMPLLHRHGRDVVAAIEEVVSGPELAKALEREDLVERNLFHLLLVYFEQVDDSSWDCVGFVRSLNGKLLHEALVAIFHIWGPTRGTNRRRSIPRNLYDTWHELIARDPEWMGDREGLSRYARNGSLALVH